MSKTNKGASANLMIGLNLRWDYKSNNPDQKAVGINRIINNTESQKKLIKGLGANKNQNTNNKTWNDELLTNVYISKVKLN